MEFGFGRRKKSGAPGENDGSCWRVRKREGHGEAHKDSGVSLSCVSRRCETRGLGRSALPAVSEIAASGTALISGEQEG